MNVLEAVRQNTEYLKKIDELEKKLSKCEALLYICHSVVAPLSKKLDKDIEEYFK